MINLGKSIGIEPKIRPEIFGGVLGSRIKASKADISPISLFDPFNGKSAEYALNTVFGDAQLGLKNNNLVSQVLLFARQRASDALNGSKVEKLFSQEDVLASKIKLAEANPIVQEGLRSNLKQNLRAFNRAFQDIEAKLSSKREALGAVLIAREQARRSLIIETLKNLPDVSVN